MKYEIWTPKQSHYDFFIKIDHLIYHIIVNVKSVPFQELLSDVKMDQSANATNT